MKLFGSICLTDIAATGKAVKASNGKIYVNIEVVEKREVGRYGDTHFVSVSCKKDERKDGVNYYVGNLKPSQYDEQSATQADVTDLFNVQEDIF